MKTLILGGTRFFGREFALACRRRGWEVTVFSRRRPEEALPAGIKQVRGDRSVRRDLAGLAGKWDIVLDNSCFGAEEAAAAVELFSGKTGLWIFTSSVRVYYTLKGAVPPYREEQTDILEEDSGLRGSGALNYAFGKRDAEKTFIRARKSGRFPVTIARLPVVIGPGEPALKAYSYWKRIADGGPLLLPGMEFRKSVISSFDAAAALESLALGKNVAGEAFNFGDTVPVSLGEWVDLSASLMNKQVKKVPVAFDWLEKKGIRPVFSPYSSRADTTLDLGKALKHFDWKSSPMKDWMKKSIDWFFLEYSGPPPADYAGRETELELIRELRK